MVRNFRHLMRQMARRPLFQLGVVGTLIYGISGGDEGIYITVAGLLILSAMLACFYPAFRAARRHPWDVLKNP